MPASVIQKLFTVEEEGGFSRNRVQQTYFLSTFLRVCWFLGVEGKVDAFRLVLSQSLCFLCWFLLFSKSCPKALV